jgi:hypothetical protein
LLPCHARAETNAAKPSGGDDILVDEFGEGGIVAPSKGSGTLMLEAINEVFGKNH